MALTKIKTGGITDSAITTAKINNDAVTDAKVADAITVTGAQTGITQVGTITAGTWNGTAIASAYLDADTAHLSTTQTFSGAKTFTSSPLLLSASSPRLSISRTSTSGNADLSFRTNNSETDGCWTVRMGSDTTPDLSFNRWTDGSTDTAIMTLNHDGSATFAGTVSLGDLDIIPTSSNVSVIKHDSGSGSLTLQGDQVNIKNKDGDETGLSYNDGGGVTLNGVVDFLYGNIYLKTNNKALVGYNTGGGAKELIKIDGSDVVQIGEGLNTAIAGNQKITKHLGIGVDYHNDTTLQIENSDSSDNSYIIDGKHTATNANGFGARFSTVATSSGRNILTLRSGASGSEVNRHEFRADGSSVQTSTNQATIQHATSYHYHQSDMGGNSADNTFAYAYMYNVSGSGSGGTTARIKYSNEGNVDYDAQWIFTTYKQAIWAETNALVLNHNNATFSGALSKGSGSFKIDHPLPSMKDTHYLVHSFTESPRADLIYRDKVTLVKGKAVVNIDTVAGMTEGTFVLLCDDVQCFTSNESNWSAVKGSVKGNILTIECEDSDSTADVAWMVVADRKDEHIMETKWTDENGKPIVEPKKETKKEEEKVEEDKDHPTGEKAVYKENA